MEKESMGGDANVDCCVDSCHLIVLTLFFSSTNIFQNQINNNHQTQHRRSCVINLPSNTLPHFSHKEFRDNMGHDQTKWQDITLPPCFCFTQQNWKKSSNKPKSSFVKSVNTHKGCWYHSWQDLNPSLMLNNQIKWQDATSPPWFCFLQHLWRPSSNKHESCFDKRVNTHKGCWYHSWQDHDPI